MVCKRARQDGCHLNQLWKPVVLLLQLITAHQGPVGVVFRGQQTDEQR